MVEQDDYVQRGASLWFVSRTLPVSRSALILQLDELALDLEWEGFEPVDADETGGTSYRLPALPMTGPSNC